MLVLSRRIGEEIVLGNDVVVHVVDIKGNKVRLGVRAPDDVRVLRSELVEGDGDSDVTGASV